METLHRHEQGKLYRAILLCYQKRLEIEAQRTKTPKMKADIKELKSAEARLKEPSKNPDFLEHLVKVDLMETKSKADNFSDGQSQKRKSRKMWHGLTQDQLTERNQKIVDHFKRTKLTVSGFAQKHAGKYGLSIRTVRLILSKPVGSLPG